jgi:hypothetical protein
MSMCSIKNIKIKFQDYDNIIDVKKDLNKFWYTVASIEDMDL